MFQNWLWREAYKSSMMNESIILFKKINSEPQISPTKLQTVRRTSRRTKITKRPKPRAKWMRASWATRRLVFLLFQNKFSFSPRKTRVNCLMMRNLRKQSLKGKNPNRKFPNSIGSKICSSPRRTAKNEGQRTDEYARFCMSKSDFK